MPLNFVQRCHEKYTNIKINICHSYNLVALINEWENMIQTTASNMVHTASDKNHNICFKTTQCVE